MAKSKSADNKFVPREQFLARIISARLTSLPTVDPDAPGLMVEVKLSVLCSNPSKGTPKFCGLQAVVYVPVKQVRGQLTTEGRGTEFLVDFGIVLPKTGYAGDLIKEQPWLVCQFGEADPVYGFQSMIDWKPAEDQYPQQVIAQALDAGSSRKDIPGLKFPRERVVLRYSKQVQLTSLIEWHLVRHLSNKYPSSFNIGPLAKATWEASDREAPSSPTDSLYKLISRIKEKIKPLDIEIRSDHNKSYRLVDLINDA